MIRFVDHQSGMFLEGEQAEKYIGKKILDSEYRQPKKDAERATRRAPGKIGNKAQKDNYDELNDDDVYEAINHGAIHHPDNPERDIDFVNTVDSMKRHARRHPTKESTMFLAVNGISLF